MSSRTEKKVLIEFLKIVDDPVSAETRFKRYSMVAMTLFMLFVFYCLSDAFDAALIPTGFSFGAGMALGLGIWFLQASTQTVLMIRHISRESIVRRLDEIEQQ